METGYSVALGTFDGLHKGHMAVLNAALSFKALIPIAVTFDEPPKRKITSSFVPMLLTAKEKNRRLKEMGFKEIFVLDYEEIHNLSPTNFLDMLFRKYNIKAVACGFNYRFGKNGEGDAALLSDYCHSNHAEAVILPATQMSGQVVSSSFIRNLIANGNITLANSLLGRPFYFKNKVVHGEKRGREIGCPTVNIELDDQLVTPKYGVYASMVNIDGVNYPAVTNIGIRPTFLLKKPISETYIIGFEGDLYDEELDLNLLDYIREEVCFDGLEELKAAIEGDKETAIKAFKSGIYGIEL